MKFKFRYARLSFLKLFFAIVAFIIIIYALLMFFLLILLKIKYLILLFVVLYNTLTYSLFFTISVLKNSFVELPKCSKLETKCLK